jgi:hypothetical protein
MSDKAKPNLSKLLRLLVAGGMALAGVDGIRAEDKGAAPTEKTEKAKEEEKELERAKAEKAEKEQPKKKADEERKAAQSDSGGVQGW